MKFCRSLFVTVFVVFNATAALSEDRAYSVSGLALGAKLNLESKTYRQYECNPSEQFDGLTWCQTRKSEKEKRGRFNAWYSILHARDGTILYVNRFQEPAYWSDDEVEQDIRTYSRKVGEQPRIFKGPSRPGFPATTIAVWGKVVLEPLDKESREALAANKNVKRGVLLDTLGNYTRSAREGFPLYRLTGGAGFVWMASNKNGRGVLRILAIDPSAFYPPDTLPAPPSPPEPYQQVQAPKRDAYSRTGFWTVSHKIAGELNGCDAIAQFRDQTVFQMALVQSSPDVKEWMIFISNARWNGWISRKRQHNLSLVTTKKWQGKFGVNNSDVLWTGNLSVEFINSIADASSIEIANGEHGLLTSIDMSDSAAAIRSVVNCVRDHPYLVATVPKPPAPRPEPTVLTGTAFFVAPNRLVTNNHVVKDCRTPVRVRFSDRLSYSALASVSAQDDTNDLALLYTDEPGTAFASFRAWPLLGERVATYGFPYSDLLSPGGSFTLGDVSSATGLRDDSRFLQVSVPVQPGNSGGPLIDMSGSVVGMISSQLSAFAMVPRRSIPQNVNFAIRSPVITNFLSAKGVPPKLTNSDATGRRALSQTDVAALAKEFTVAISCEGEAQ